MFRQPPLRWNTLAPEIRLLSVGEQLGPYEVVGQIGAGGMGEVYRARDTRLDREVAIKVSAERFSERFEREARLIASLNHPNICSLFDVGPNFLVMELVEGPTLAERIAEGAIPLEESLHLAAQIADALEAAHETGIVHRDLKPGNIKIKPDGTVKVLDFGLAKMDGTSVASSDHSPTREVFLNSDFDERSPSLSPDGKWIAYSSNESGTFEVYVRAFPDRGGKWQVSNAGGAYPMWSRSGRELFFENFDANIMTASYSFTNDSFVAEKPRAWSPKAIVTLVNSSKNFDLAPDGKRIAALMPVETSEDPGAQNHVTFLFNFLDELERRVPAGK